MSMNENNPYRPSTVTSGPYRETADPAHLRAIASAQRQVNLAVLIYLCLVPVNIVAPALAEKMPWIGLVTSLIGLSVFAFGAVCVYRLAALFRGKVVAILYAVGLCVPCLGLLLLVIISQKATKILQENGVTVGLLGANPDEIK